MTLIRLNRAIRSKPSSRVMPNPMKLAPCESTWLVSRSIAVPWRIAPSTMACTSEAEHDSSGL